MTSEQPPLPPDGTSQPPAAVPGPPLAPDAAGDDAPRRLHPAAWLIEGLRVGQSALLPLVIIAFGQGAAVAFGALGLLVTVSLGIGIAVWRTTTYTTSGGKLVLRKGIITTREQEVPAARISALDTSRGILQRIFGVVELQVQTAGGGDKAELRLRAVSFAEAERIRGALGHALATASQPPAAAPATGLPAHGAPAAALAAPAAPSFLKTGPEAALAAEQVVYKMPGSHLVIAALTSPSLALVGAAIAGGASQLQDVVPDSFTSDLGHQAERLTATAIVALAVLALLATAALAVAGTVLAYSGFTITRDERRIRIRRGLLTERFSTIPIDRIHGVRIVETPLRQLLGYASLQVDMAGYSAGASSSNEITTTLVPLVPTRVARQTLAAIAPPLATTTERDEPVPGFALAGVPQRGHRRYLQTALLWAAIPTIALAAAPIGVGRALAIAPLTLATALAITSARAAGWTLLSRGGDDGADLLVLRWRAWSRSTLIADRARLQRAELHTSPGQRSRKLATFAVALSSRREARVRHLEASTAHELAAIATARHTPAQPQAQ